MTAAITGFSRSYRDPLAAFGLVAKVVAGAEPAPGPGHDGYPHVVVGGKVVEDLAEFGVAGRMQGVEPLRAVQGDRHDVVTLVDTAEFGHENPLNGVLAGILL